MGRFKMKGVKAPNPNKATDECCEICKNAEIVERLRNKIAEIKKEKWHEHNWNMHFKEQYELLQSILRDKKIKTWELNNGVNGG